VLELGRPRAWRPPLLRTCAACEEGSAALLEALAAHGAHLESSGELARVERRRARRPFEERVRAELGGRLRAALATGGEAEALLAQVERRALDPYSAAELWLARWGEMP
jgi:LAO/AO transport system kinase